MNHDFGNVFDPEGMTDDELYDLLMQEFDESPHLQPDWIEVRVKDGFVTLSGFVGSDTEVQVAEKIVADVIGVERFSNELMVNDIHRALAPEAADESITEAGAGEDPLGGAQPQQSDTAAHLVEDLEEQAYGTHDRQAAIQDGAPYIPPDGAFPDGYRSTENH